MCWTTLGHLLRHSNRFIIVTPYYSMMFYMGPFCSEVHCKEIYKNWCGILAAWASKCGITLKLESPSISEIVCCFKVFGSKKKKWIGDSKQKLFYLFKWYRNMRQQNSIIAIRLQSFFFRMCPIVDPLQHTLERDI